MELELGVVCGAGGTFPPAVLAQSILVASRSTLNHYITDFKLFSYPDVRPEPERRQIRGTPESVPAWRRREKPWLIQLTLLKKESSEYESVLPPSLLGCFMS